HVRTVDRLHAGDILEINLQEQQKHIPLCDLVVPILYEDEDVIVFNKPADMPVHQSGGHIFNTLDGVYAAHCALSGEIVPLRALNRLDKDTTGAVVVAQNQIAAGKLWKSVSKRYIAVVEGIPKPSDGTVDLP
ncbi:MAG: pseudouridine synthase, partial [Angelakisella sp.]